MPRINLELRSTWGHNCKTGLVDTDWSPYFGGWSDWSEALITSEWDGGPWSCLEARIHSDIPDTAFRVQMYSSWTPACATGWAETGFTRPDGAFGEWSSGLITSEWNGSPWSCLTMRVASTENAPVTCKVRLLSEWSSACQTGSGRTGPVRFDRDGQSPWTPSIITSEWNGQPWSCLRAQLVCAPNL